MWQLVLALVGLGVMARVALEHTVLVPTPIGGGSTSTPTFAVLPLAWAAAVAYSLQNKCSQVEARPVRRLGVLDVAWWIAVCVTAVVVLDIATGG